MIANSKRFLHVMRCLMERELEAERKGLKCIYTGQIRSLFDYSGIALGSASVSLIKNEIIFSIKSWNCVQMPLEELQPQHYKWNGRNATSAHKTMLCMLPGWWLRNKALETRFYLELQPISQWQNHKEWWPNHWTSATEVWTKHLT